MIKMKKNEEKIILIIIITVLLLFSLNKLIVSKPESVGIENKVSKTENTVVSMENEEKNKIFVYVVGEVNKPGVYILRQGDRVVDAVNMAGGFTVDADVISINLAEKLKDEKIITVLRKNSENNISNNTVKSTVINGKIDINSATAKELDEFLPGIGETLANNIVNYRLKNGKFKSVDELSRVDGIGNGKRFEKIRELIYIN